jgi:hypothetical protein
MDRRNFLRMAAGGMVATATMAEVGFWADFMVWVKRMPTWSFPKPLVSATISQFDDYISFNQLAAVYYDKKAVEALNNSFNVRYLSSVGIHRLTI